MKKLLCALLTFNIISMGAMANEFFLHDIETIEMSEGEIKAANESFDEFIKINDSIIQRARMGDVVGNGGGLIEGQVAFFYNSLEKAIVGTIEENRDVYDDREIKVLENIANIITGTKAKEKIVFIDDQRFFGENKTREIRSAKTGFSEYYPIFLNRPLLYKNIESDYSPIVALLVHELGHQTGVKSHTFLDSLGAKVQANLNARADEIYTRYHSQKLEVILYNYANVGSWSDIMVRFDNKVNSLPKIEYSTLKTKCENKQPIGYEMENVHWATRPMFTERYFVAHVNSWVNFRCVDNEGQIFSFFGTMRVRITVSLHGISFKTEVR